MSASTAKAVDVRDAQAAIEADRQARMKSAAEEIRTVLERHRCELTAMPQIAADGRIVAQVQLVAQ